MFYKILPDTNLGRSLIQLSDKMNAANLATYAFVDKLGYKRFFKLRGVLAGGISGIEITGTPPAGWKRVFTRDYNDIYLPKNTKANKELWQQINALPTVNDKELNTLLNYDWRKLFNGKNIELNPSVTWRTHAIYISISQHAIGYQPRPDMVEILHSEYLAATTRYGRNPPQRIHRRHKRNR